MNVLKLTAENPEELLTTGAYGAGALIRIERSTTQGGTYAEVGTVALVSGTTLYTYYDQSAPAGSWYRTRYSNAANNNRSEYSAEFQAATEPDIYGLLYDVKQRLGKAPTDTADDEELLQHGTQVAGFMDSRMGRHIGPAPETSITLDGAGATKEGRCLLVPRGVRSLSSVTVALSTGDTPQPLTIAGNVLLRPVAAERQPGWPATQLWLSDIAPYRWWPRGYDNVVLGGAFGWERVPAEINAIWLRLTINSWRGKASGGAQSFVLGVEGERHYEFLLSYEEKVTLDNYSSRVLVA